ncbi:MAG TPA: zf-TFIIB domain-containing protein [Burkholderiales bacterium]
MKCPVCGEPDLLMSERQGIEIDYCPKCRGVWLDRGELDKLIDRAAPQAGPAPSPQHPAPQHSREYRDDDPYRRGHKRKRGGFLGEIFDFD